MTCGLSHYEDNPLKDKLRQERAEKKNLTEATKIAKFFDEALGGKELAYLAKCENVGFDPTKIHLTEVEGGLVVFHRGWRITAKCEDPSDLAKNFRMWCSSGESRMTHARIFPRIHKIN